MLKKYFVYMYRYYVNALSQIVPLKIHVFLLFLFLFIYVYILKNAITYLHYDRKFRRNL